MSIRRTPTLSSKDRTKNSQKIQLTRYRRRKKNTKFTILDTGSERDDGFLENNAFVCSSTFLSGKVAADNFVSTATRVAGPAAVAFDAITNQFEFWFKQRCELFKSQNRRVAFIRTMDYDCESSATTMPKSTNAYYERYCPDRKATKMDVKNFILRNEIRCKALDVQQQQLAKPELFKVATDWCKFKGIEYNVDKIARDHGHRTIELPSQFRELNPIERIWSKLIIEKSKSEAAAAIVRDQADDFRSSTASSVDYENLTNILFVNRYDDIWLKCIAGCRALENEYAENEHRLYLSGNVRRRVLTPRPTSAPDSRIITH